MAFEIVWTKRAARGYDKIVNYLAENWSDKEVITFITNTDSFFETLANHPEILQKTNKAKNTYRGPINNLTILTYKLQPLNKQIILLNIRGARQKPLK
jgi:plasmid stabilization system protein ParE